MRLAYLVYRNDAAFWEDDRLQLVESAILAPGTFEPHPDPDGDGGERTASSAESARNEVCETGLDAFKDFDFDFPAGLSAIVFDLVGYRCNHPLDPEEWDVDHQVVYDAPLSSLPASGEWWRPAAVCVSGDSAPG